MGEPELRYEVTNKTTRVKSYYDTAEEVIAKIPVPEGEFREFIFVLFDVGAKTTVENEAGTEFDVEIVRTTAPPAGEPVGGRRKKSASKKQMHTRKHRRGGRRHTKRVIARKYMEAPRSRSVFQIEGGRRKSHRRL